MTVSPASGKEIHPRLPWVEIARLLATLVVIMQHVPSMGFPPNQWLIGPALATFFLLAGYFSASGLDEQGAGTWAGRRLLVAHEAQSQQGTDAHDYDHDYDIHGLLHWAGRAVAESPFNPH